MTPRLIVLIVAVGIIVAVIVGIDVFGPMFQWQAK